MTINNQKLCRLVALMAFCASTAMLAACGGGGGAGDSAAGEPRYGAASAAAASAAAAAAAPDPVPVSEADPAAEAVSAFFNASVSASAPMVSVQFTATDAEIPNPERGFYRWAWSDLNQFSKDDGADAYKKGIRIVYAMVRLDAYKSTALPASLLQGLRSGFSNARQSGVKIIPRFVYNYPESETEYHNATDASLSRVLAHISQLKPVLQDNADVIAYLQAGFIGAWGEWHTSSNGLTGATSRKRIRDALLDALPQQQFVQFRYPPHVMAWFATPPSELDAFSGSASSRSGLHNDCFLASATDVGTYSDNATTRQQQRNYAMALAKVTPFGGETCNPADDPGAQPRTSCADILAEGRQFSLTYLNNDYYTTAFHARWKRDGCYNEVKRLMGYRLEFLSAGHLATVAAGAAWPVTLSVRNVGWARPYKARELSFLLKHRVSGNVVKLVSSVDPRSWTAGNTFTHDVSLAIPAGAQAGRYEIYIALPDGAAQLNSDARFAMRPANANNTASRQAWSPSLGAFRLGTTLMVN
ncbi:MAG: DUF4832 domain-containing protein [Pseudomonadota bacterium]